MRNEKSRLALARAIRERLPWSSVVAGSKGHPFIRIDRGETIVGSSRPAEPQKSGWQGSAWSRPVEGSRYLLWDASRGYVEICQNVPCPPKYAEAWKVLKTFRAPRKTGTGWTAEAAGVLVELSRRWLRPVTPDRVNKQLRKDERFKIRIHPLRGVEP